MYKVWSKILCSAHPASGRKSVNCASKTIQDKGFQPGIGVRPQPNRMLISTNQQQLKNVSGNDQLLQIPMALKIQYCSSFEQIGWNKILEGLEMDWSWTGCFHGGKEYAEERDPVIVSRFHKTIHFVHSWLRLTTWSLVGDSCWRSSTPRYFM